MYCIDRLSHNFTGIEELSPSRYLNRELFKFNIRIPLYENQHVMTNLREVLGSHYFLWPFPVEPKIWRSPQYWVDRYGEHLDADGELEEEEERTDPQPSIADVFTASPTLKVE